MRVLALIFVVVALSAVSTHAAPVEYESTVAWWGKRGHAAEGNPVSGFALPVLSGDRMLGTLTLVFPRQSERGAFLQIPMAIYPSGDFKGKKVTTIIGINSQAFVGFVDDDRFLVYLNAKAPPPLPGMKAGTSVREALREARGTIHVRTDPASSSGIIVKPTRTEAAAPGLAERLRSQGLQPASLGEVLKECDAFMKGSR